jgi:hypothetical protein
MTEAIKRVARGIADAHGPYQDGGEWERFTNEARAAITALREPTLAMSNAMMLAAPLIDRGNGVKVSLTCHEIEAIFRAGIDAALGKGGAT